MKLCRFQHEQGGIKPGLILEDSRVVDLAAAGFDRCEQLLELPDVDGVLRSLAERQLSELPLAQVRLQCPLDQQEVWAAGVTYLRSKSARMEESSFSATAYDRVYEAPRPEIFFKAAPGKAVGPGMPVGIRKDARWSVPEPELALVLNSRADIVGFTVGNDMSSRDIEGENLLYLPQAKIYRGSCALGPWIVTGVSEAEARGWSINLSIRRAGEAVFSGSTAVGNMKRPFQDLMDYLFRSQEFPCGAVLLTGTGIVPPDGLSLRPGDEVRIEISGVGVLANPVVEV